MGPIPLGLARVPTLLRPRTGALRRGDPPPSPTQPRNFFSSAFVALCKILEFIETEGMRDVGSLCSIPIRGIKGRAARGEAKARGGHLSSTPNTISLTPAESLFV